MPTMLDDTLSYLRGRAQRDPNFTYEIIIVDDGSKDRTTEVGLHYVQQNDTNTVRVMTLRPNRGKGGAVQQGMLHARGEYVLMADADAATQISDVEKLEARLKEISQQSSQGVAVGSRAHLEENAIASRKWYRNFLMHGFHFMVSFFAVKGVRDTQCGFKLFTRATAATLFSSLHLFRWCFDVELLYIAQTLKIPITEVAVTWTEIPGSKLSLIESSLTMARDLVLIRFCYMFGIWKIQYPKKSN
eukprot:TRINITY_DN3429_c0_g1_i7.p1 TRINITY_DN3429_c0_g1~~TRINITY_DN3429_c0_g1_i7.p1  ORF type:complete len:245 (-),score=73.43 TRINITY_DN3429_c0_g1_i7:44-778(-)